MKLAALILAGGSGTRLWPASRAAAPKQYLSFDGGPSYLQQALLRARRGLGADRGDHRRGADGGGGGAVSGAGGGLQRPALRPGP